MLADLAGAAYAADTSYKKGQPNLNVMFQYNVPLRALAKMTSGAISMGMVDGIVLEAKELLVYRSD